MADPIDSLARAALVLLVICIAIVVFLIVTLFFVALSA
jgi:hypothetical protein